MNSKKPLIPKKKVVESLSSQMRRFGNLLNENSITNRLDPRNYNTAEEYMQVLEQVDPGSIVEAINDRLVPDAMFPSSWKFNDWPEVPPYPAILAQALVRSSANESVTDLGNVYYARRKYSKEAMEIFRRDAISNPTTKELMTEWGMVNLHELSENEPQTFKKILLTFSPDELQAFIEAENDEAGFDIRPTLKQLGL